MADKYGQPISIRLILTAIFAVALIFGISNWHSGEHDHGHGHDAAHSDAHHEGHDHEHDHGDHH